MAFPLVEGVRPTTATGIDAAHGSVAATSHVVTLPATVSPGALLMIFGRVTVAGDVAFTGGGWTIVQDSSDASDDVTFWAYQDTLATGTEGGNDITCTHGNGKMVAFALSITGAEDPSVQPPESSTIAVGSSTTVDASACTPTGGAKDYLWICFGSHEGEQTVSKTPPTNYTDNNNDIRTGTAGGTGDNCQAKICTRELNAASENPGSYTISVTDQWAAWTFAVHPAGAGGTPHTVDPADSVTLSDAVSFERSIVLADTVGLADNAATAVDKVRTFDDTVGVSDFADPVKTGGTTDHTLTPSDSVSLADTFAMDRGVAISDTISLSDSITVNRGLSLADSFTLADQMLTSKGISLSPADTLSLTDNATTETGKEVTVDDSITVSDEIRFDRAMAFAEALSLADAIAKDHGITVEDVIAIADLADPQNVPPSAVDHELNFDDSVTVSDALSFIRELTRNEVLPVSDSHTRTFNGVILSDGQEARVFRGRIVIGRF